jgi:hypothetical protein
VTDYCTTDDVAARLGRPLTPEEETQAAVLITDISMLVDLSLGDCLDTVYSEYPDALAMLVARASIRVMNTPLSPAIQQTRLADAWMRYSTSPYTGGGSLLSEQDIDFLNFLCTGVPPSEIKSVVITSTMPLFARGLRVPWDQYWDWMETGVWNVDGWESTASRYPGSQP